MNRKMTKTRRRVGNAELTLLSGYYFSSRCRAYVHNGHQLQSLLCFQVQFLTEDMRQCETISQCSLKLTCVCQGPYTPSHLEAAQYNHSLACKLQICFSGAAEG